MKPGNPLTLFFAIAAGAALSACSTLPQAGTPRNKFFPRAPSQAGTNFVSKDGYKIVGTFCDGGVRTISEGQVDFEGFFLRKGAAPTLYYCGTETNLGTHKTEYTSPPHTVLPPVPEIPNP